MTASERKDFKRALDLLFEMRYQTIVTDAAWESTACRRWIKKADVLLYRNRVKDEDD